MVRYCTLVIIALLCAGATTASSAERSIQVIGRPSITVTGREVSLSDLAEIRSREVGDEETMVALGRIIVAKSPAPGKMTEVTGEEVLRALQVAQVALDQIRYVFPKVTQVARAGRTLRRVEVDAAIEDALRRTSDDIEVRRVTYGENVLIPTGDVRIRAEPFRSSVTAQVGFTITVSAAEGEEIRFPVYASVEEWREVPVAARSVTKGTVIGPDDVMMARLNLRSLPKDAAREIDEIVGREVSVDFGEGEVLRKGKMSIPPVVTAGARVTLVYRKGNFEATATGVALDSGVFGDAIRVRNEASKRIVSGTVLDPGIIGVNP